MTTRTPTKPLDDPGMLRKLVARAHPDAGGDGELFIFANALRERLLDGALALASEVPRCSECERGKRNRLRDEELERIPFAAEADFAYLTRRALLVADDEAPTFARLLRLLHNCCPLARLRRQQERGATYKQLAYVAHLAGMGKTERVSWYRVAEAIPLADRHVSHILDRLKERAA